MLATVLAAFLTALPAPARAADDPAATAAPTFEPETRATQSETLPAGETAGGAIEVGTSQSQGSTTATGSDPAPATNANVPDDGTGNGKAKGAKTDQTVESTQAASATAAATQVGTGNGRIAVRVDKPGNGPKVEQGNTVTAAASASTAVDVATDRPAAPDQSASSIPMGSVDSGSPSSTGAPAVTPAETPAVTPAETPAVTPAETPTAGDASGSVEAAAGATIAITQQAGSDATATQRDTSNVNLSVRVYSPGDDGAVTQANTATATASAGVSAISGSPESAGGDNVAASSADARATASQQNVTNTNVAVRIFSPGDTGDVSQENAAAAQAAAASGTGPDTGPSSFRGADATAVQSGARNTNVMIRVASPGSDGQTIQKSTVSTIELGTVSTGDNANASQMPQSGEITPVVVDTQGLDTNVVVNLNGNTLPTSLAGTDTGTITVWRWNWTWDGASTGIPADVSSWNWTWGGDSPTAMPAGLVSVTSESVPSEQAGADVVAGSWTWIWNWSRPGDWSWNWAPTLVPDCSSCAWVWTWDWNWSEDKAEATTTAAQPAAPTGSGETAVNASAPDDGPAIVQSNTVTAVASAAAEATLVEAVAQVDPSGAAAPFAGQIVTLAQSVSAAASALQRDAANVTDDGAPAAQSNSITVEAEAVAGVEASQRIEQGNAAELDQVTPAQDVEQWAGQQVEITQTAAADATGAQLGVINLTVDGASEVVARATASARVAALQDVDQENGAGTGDRSQWAGQQFEAEQFVVSSADSSQQGGGRVAKRYAKSQATAKVKTVSLQASQQVAAGDADGSQVSRQLVQVFQGAAATATTAQPSDTYVGLQGVSFATSEANASNAALAVELSTQVSFDGGTQDTTQNVFFLQTADATSTSGGGLAGVASVTNCGTAQQSSRQAIGSDASGWVAADATAFCTPPSPVNPEPAGTTSAASPEPEQLPSAEQLPSVDEDDLPRHGFGHQRYPRIHVKDAHVTIVQPDPTPASHEVATGSAVGASTAEISTPILEGPARTPPGDRERVGKAGEEPPLPPAPVSISGAGSAGPAPSAGGGVAVIPSTLRTTPPDYWRTWVEPTVRRSEHFSGRLETPG